MSKDSPRVYLLHIRDHTREIIALTQNTSQTDFGVDRKLFLAVTRLLEIIGEAANRFPPTLRQNYPQIPWRSLIGMRNRLIHAYDDVDEEIVWRTISDDLLPLLISIEEILNDFQV